jgi:hypothetical protein
LAELVDNLLDVEPPWVLAIGGIGKTALADALVRRIFGDYHFRDVI